MADFKSLNEVLKQVNKKYGITKDDGSTQAIGTLGCNKIGGFGTLSLRSPSLDYCVYNSIPEGRIIEISGAEGSGKTTTAFLLAADFQRKEIKRNPNNPRKILYVDLEITVDPDWAAKAGYDMSENAEVGTIYLTPLDMDGEHILDIIRDFVKTGEVGLVILDSIPYLVGQQVYEESFEKKEMGGIAKLLTTFVSRITSLLVKNKCTLIGINQLRDNIGGYGQPWTTPGGRSWKFGCTLRLMIKRGSFIDEEGNVLTSSAESPAGYVMEMAVLKTKCCKWDRKVGACQFSYTDGVDYIADTIDVAVKLGLIDNSVQGSFKLIDLDTGEVLKDDYGNELKIRGKKNIKPYMKEHPDVFRKLYDKVYEMITTKDITNIQQFEQLMNLTDNSLAESLDFTDADAIESL